MGLMISLLVYNFNVRHTQCMEHSFSEATTALCSRVIMYCNYTGTKQHYCITQTIGLLSYKVGRYTYVAVFGIVVCDSMLVNPRNKLVMYICNNSAPLHPADSTTR